MCIPDEDEDFDEYKLTLTLVIENDQIKEIKDISGDGRRIAGERAGRGTIKKDPGAGILYQYLRAG